jgi:hypothetical protein
MQIRWNQNQKSSDEVKEEPSDRQAGDHANARHKPPCGPVGGFDRCESPLKAV